MHSHVLSSPRSLKVIAVILITAVLVSPSLSLAQDAMVGAKVSIDSGGKVSVNNVAVYRLDGEPLYADSGQIMSDAAEAEEGEPWYEPSVGKFLIGLVVVGACVGIGFIVDNNIDHDRYEWYYDENCDCYKRRKVD